MESLLGWRNEDAAGRHVLTHIHPDDVAWVAESLVDIVGSGAGEPVGPWASIQMRLITSDGKTLPVEVTGRLITDDGHSDVVVYDVRPAHSLELMRSVLSGVALGEPSEHLLAMVIQMIGLPPVELHSVALERTEAGEFRIAAASSPMIGKAVAGARDPLPWSTIAEAPVFTDTADLPGATGEALRAIGMVDSWHVSFASPDGTFDGRIVTFAPMHHVPANGPIQRLIRARELAQVVLLRADTDRLLKHAAHHDSLTHLTNRRGFYNSFEAPIERGAVRSVLFVDLDNFKPVNDRFGHSAGDRVLKEVADRLRTSTREGDVVSRIGGDEFAILLAPTSTTADAEARAIVVAGRVHSSLQSPFKAASSVSISASIGIVLASADEVSDRIMAEADAAMYEAKRAGGAQHRIVRLGV